MFPLFQSELPTSAAGLATVLDGSLRRALQIPNQAVFVRDRAYPNVDEIAIDLSGATLRTDAPRFPFSEDAGEPAISAVRLTLNARPLVVSGASIDLALAADDIVLHQNRGPDGNIVLSLHRADNGEIGIWIREGDLERLVVEGAKTQAGRQGVIIEDVLLNLTSRDSHSLGLELRIQARKLFLRTSIRIVGQLNIDDELVARFSGVECSGEGGIGTIACGMLAPHLQKLQAREFPLLAFSLGGEMRLRDINLIADDGIKITAEFGAGASA
jgi:hypothetical protein